MILRPLSLVAVLVLPTLAFGARDLRFPLTVQRVMDRLDTNSDQVLDATEYQRITRGSIKFEKADLDANGSISMVELESLLIDTSPLTGGLDPIVHTPVQAYLPGDSAQTFRPPVSTEWPKPGPVQDQTEEAQQTDEVPEA